MALCPGCQAQVLAELDRLEGNLKQQNADLLRQLKDAWHLIEVLELQRAGYQAVIEQIGREKQAERAIAKDKTLPLFAN